MRTMLLSFKADVYKRVLSGEKIAISSLYAYCRMNLKEISKVGDYAILDSSGDEVCVVRILFTV